jgi:hypothetical protein
VDAADLRLQMRDPVNARFLRLLPVAPYHLIKITAGAFLKMVDAQRDLSGGEVSIPVAHRFKLNAVDSHASTTQNIDTEAAFNEACSGLADG